MHGSKSFEEWQEIKEEEKITDWQKHLEKMRIAQNKPFEEWKANRDKDYNANWEEEFKKMREAQDKPFLVWKDRRDSKKKKMQRNQNSGAENIVFNRRLMKTEGLGNLLDTLYVRVEKKSGTIKVRLFTHWEKIVGNYIAKMAEPIRTNYYDSGKKGILTVRVKSGSEALIVSACIETIRLKINSYFGMEIFTKIFVRQIY